MSLIFVTLFLAKDEYTRGKSNRIEYSSHINAYSIYSSICMFMQHISAWACLIRSDYNFVFLFFAYFYLASKKDRNSILIVNMNRLQIFSLVILLIIMDILFFVFVPGSWMSYQENNTVWNNLHGLHGFAIFLSVIIFLLKVDPRSFRSHYYILCSFIKSN